jgi:DNA-binding transcriptional MerR regulator
MSQKIPIGVAAKHLGVSIQTIRAWCDCRKLEYSRDPYGNRLFDIEDLDAARRFVRPNMRDVAIKRGLQEAKSA